MLDKAAHPIACLLLVLATGVSVAAEGFLGPSAVVASPDGRTLFVANADAGQIAVVDLQRGKVLRSFPVPSKPTGLALSPDGSNLYATCAAGPSVVVVIDTASGKSSATIPVGHTATSPAVTPDGKRLFVCNRFDNDVSVIDLDANRETARLPVVREPLAAAVTHDGNSLVVANHLPADRSDRFYVTPIVTIIDVQSHQAINIRLPNGSTGLRGVCISSDGRHAYVSHILANYELVPAQVVGGWTNTNVVSVIDTHKKKLVNTVKLDDYYLGAANPWGLAGSPDGKWLCVTHAGTDELSIIDQQALLEKLYDGTHVSAVVGGIPNSPSIVADFRRRVKLSGKGSRAVAVVGSKAYVAQYFSDILNVVDLESQDENCRNTIALGPAPRLTVRRRGQILFNDATICYQHWQSCASCHPDARADGLNWDLTNDGVGNPKNTKSMLLAHRTPPAMVTGVRPSAEAAVRSGLEHILFADQPENVAAAIDDYLKSLRSIPSPRLVSGRLSPAARRGRLLFDSDRVGCYKCHPGPLYTDLLSHNVGTQGPYDHRERFDTPTLIEVWRTAPYLHDGRYTTIQELITEGKHGSSRGNLTELDDREIDDLAAFVLSL